MQPQNDPNIEQIIHSLQLVANYIAALMLVILPLAQKYGGRVIAKLQPPEPPAPQPGGDSNGNGNEYSTMLTGEIIKRIDDLRTLVTDQGKHTERRFSELESDISERFQRVRERIDTLEPRIGRLETPTPKEQS